MDIKQTNQKTTYLNLFDIADSSRKEVHLSKILAYVMAKDERALRAFLGLLDIDAIKGKWRSQLHENASVCIEKSYSDKGARTDIEIRIDNPKVFIIVECKVKGGKATEGQFKKYEPIYNRQEYNDYKKYFVFLSHQSGINLLDSGDIEVIDITWRSVINSFWDVCNAEEVTDFRDFINYYERSYAMFNQKEILVQDVDAQSVERFERLFYRRDKVNGAPLYFAPYFTRVSGKKEGISAISKILGIITTKDISWEKVEDRCRKFLELASKDEEAKERILAKWQEGVDDEQEKGTVLTYYFLDEPVRLKPPLVKKNTKDSKGWIGGMISKNRCVTFAEFMRNSVLFDNNP